MQNTLTPPRQIADQFEVFGFDYDAGDGLCMGLSHEDLDGNTVWIDYDEEDPTYYAIEGHLCYSVEEVHSVLEDILESPEMYI